MGAPKLFAGESAAAFAKGRSGYSIGGSDRFEREAERNQKRIRSMLDTGSRSRLGGLEASAGGGSIRRSPLTAPPPPGRPAATGALTTTGGGISIGTLRLTFKDAGVSGEIRRSALGGDMVLARAKGGTVAVGEGMRRSSGTSLPRRVRSLLEPAFGRTFADVRIHVDSGAAMAAAAVNAEAFTLGRDIYFNRGYYDPGSPKGLALIGHELTHVAQNKGGSVQRKGITDTVSDWYADLNPAYAYARDLSRSGKTFAAEIDAAVASYRTVGAVNFEDTQDHGERFRQNAWSSGHFNSAEPDVKTGFKGGQVVTDELGMWLDKKQKVAERIRQSDLIYKALELNVGNLPLAMGTIAGALADSRKRADNIDGLGGNLGKDYYRYAGAFVALQSLPLRTAGLLASKGDIGWTGVVHTISQEKSYLGPTKSKNFQFDIGYTSIDEIKRKALTVAGDDAAERQAVSNERSIYRALSTGGRPARLRATAAAPAVRRKSLWEYVSGQYEKQKAERQEFWTNIAARGDMRGGAVGKAQYWLGILGGTLSDSVDPVYLAQQTSNFAIGLGVGAYDSVKGTVNMIVHPIETAEGIYNLVVNFDQTKAHLGQKVKDLLALAQSDPARFAREMGEITGQIEMALIGPKAIGGTREVVGAIRSAKNLKMLGGKALWVYSDAKTAAMIKQTGRVGAAGAKSAWATPLDPLLGGSDSFFGKMALRLATGGGKSAVWDFMKVDGKLVRTVRAGHASATRVAGGAFRPIMSVPVEHWASRLLKSAGFQMAAEGPQNIRWLSQAILNDPLKAAPWFQAMDAVVATTNVLGDQAVVQGQSNRSDAVTNYISHFAPELAAQEGQRRGGGARRKRRGSSRYSDEDPEVARLFHDVVDRYGHEPGVSLDFTTKSRLERFLGRELGDVRLHTGPLAREVARATEAEAITFGQDIYLPSERLGGAGGLDLLAHEATHVAQAAPATPVSSPRSLGAGASVEVMEDVARSIEARFAGSARASTYPVLAEPSMREAPAAPAAFAAAVAPASSAPALEAATPAPAVADAAPHRRAAGDTTEQTPGFDPVGEVMRSFHVPSSVSQEEFLAICTERLIDLVKDELAGDADRRETLAWNNDLPNA